MSKTSRIPAFCTQCRSRCGCTAVVEDGRLRGLEPLPGHPSGDKLCPKGLAAPELVYHPDRIRRPMRRTAPKGAADPGFVEIGWDEALDEIAARMSDIRTRYGAEQVAFSITTPSGSHIQDSISWIERLVRVYGSPNTIYATEICNWHKDHASRFTYGSDIGTPDFANADCILLWGNNPAVSWLARTAEIQKGLKAGAKLVMVDPRPTVLARRATHWLRVRPGTDQAVALGLANLMIEAQGFDRNFVHDWTNATLLVRDDTGHILRESDIRPGGRRDVLMARDDATGGMVGFDATRASWSDPTVSRTLCWAGQVEGAAAAIACHTAFEAFARVARAWTPERVEAVTGIAADTLRSAARTISEARRVAYFCWNGVGQSVTATQTDRAISILYALTGSYGDAGGNIPGTAATFGDISGREFVRPEQRAKAIGLSERPLGPGLDGWVTARDVYKAIVDGVPYPVRMLMSFGTNLLAAQPDTTAAREALSRLEFHVHADFFVNATAAYADIVLPAATSWEREGLRTGFDASIDGLRHVQLRPRVIEPVAEARSDTDIVIELARRLGHLAEFFDGDVDRGHDAVLRPAGLSVAELRASPGGVQLATGVAVKAYATVSDGVARGFATPSRRIEIYSERLLDAGYPPVPRLDDGDLIAAQPGFPLRLGSAKTIAFCHSQHRNVPSLRRLMPDPMIEISSEDAAARGITHGQWVEVRTVHGAIAARAAVTTGLEPGAVFGQHGWWVDIAPPAAAVKRGAVDGNINRLIGTERSDPVSGSIPLRSYWCEVTPLPA